MKDFIVSILVAFVLFKLVKGFFADKQDTQRQSNNNRPEGFVDIKQTNTANKANENNDGEYISYEEIK
ncbi:MAG: hypothetical protein IPO27_09110 [Bacteroidetes bacterium]|nr:hypothetical protein [Bacteroidota bacterium]